MHRERSHPLRMTRFYTRIFFFPGRLFLMDFFPVEIGKCGVNCSLTSCFRSGRCKGCGSEDTNQKRTSKWKCKIRVCVSENNLHHCGECKEYPCRLRSTLDTRYLKKYSIDLNENIRLLCDLGPDAWLERERNNHTCRVCGDIVNPYSQECYGCGEKSSSD